MKKTAGPWLGSTDLDMASLAPKGDEKDLLQESSQPYDTLTPTKSMTGDSVAEVNAHEGIISPVTDVDVETSCEDQVGIKVLDGKHLIASFSCQVAKTLQKKIIGLQSYSSLQETAGLLFPYQRTEDVLYHMGTVSFPIDVLFVDEKNQVKKIFKNIQPGSLATFGCAGVKHVLEICGGLSDRLGISCGNKLSFVRDQSFNKQSFGFNKHSILKFSKLEKTRLTEWNEHPLLVYNTSDLKKQAGNTLLAEFLNHQNKSSEKEIQAFNFDGLLAQSSALYAYAVVNSETENSKQALDLDQNIIAIDEKRSIKTTPETLSTLPAEYQVVLSLAKSFKDFIKLDQESLKLFCALKDSLLNKGSRTVLITKYADPETLRKLILTRVKLALGDTYLPNSLEVLQVDGAADASDLLKALQEKFPNQEIKIYSDESLLKRAGIPVSDDIKVKAKEAYRFLDEAIKIIELSVDNFETNVEEYGKIKDKPEQIAQTQAQYQKSMNAQVRVVKNYLLKLREAIRILNEIKDISTTFEIIDALAASAKATSDGAEHIFEMLEKLDNSDFHMILSEKTDQYQKQTEDLMLVIDRAKQYVNTEILGLVILSA